jgi:TolB-like protein
VLPFADMSGDPGQEYFADGISEDLVTGLARIRWLFVIARNSTFAYKHRAVDAKQVSRELGVRYVLEGSVRRAGNRCASPPSSSMRRRRPSVGRALRARAG